MAQPIQLNLSLRQDNSGNDYQHLEIILNQPHILPESLKNLELPSEKINLNLGLIFYGRVPCWLYAYLSFKCPSVSWVGCYQPQLNGAVVVNTKKPTPYIGDVVQINLPEEEIKKEITKKRQDAEKQLSNLNLDSSTEIPVNKNSIPTEEGDLELEAIFLEAIDGKKYQCLSISALHINPSCLNSLSLPKLDPHQGIILWGSAPNWLYAYLTNRLQNHAWVACYNVYNGAVIVVSNSSQFEPGDSFDLAPKLPCPVVIIGGPPDSGKSVLAHALERTLNSNGYLNQVHLVRAHWDGHGDWFSETKKTSLALLLSCLYGGKPDNPDAFFKQQTNLIDKVRSGMKLLIVDFGGDPQPSDRILLTNCSHYIIISSKKEEVNFWQEFFAQGQLEPLAVIHSVSEDKLEVLESQPFLEIIAGPWQQRKTKSVPPILLSQVEQLMKNSRPV